MKRILSIALLLSALAGAAWAASNVQAQNGGYVNAKTGAAVNSSGSALVDDAARDRDSYLAPVQIYTGTIAAGAADTTSIVDLSGYRSVALLVQVSGTSTNSWVTFAVNARYNLAGAADSLSLFTIPVMPSDSSVVVPSSMGGGFVARGVLPGAAAFGDGEFPITITTTSGSGGAASHSMPQGRVVWLKAPTGSFAWPSQCSFRFRNILRSVANTPTVRVWVMGTPL